ncbi:MAG TPA: DedA family protein [Solirubrobacteraceae bacterium]|nr:DedA family protein [Solirubrobacteraceae bacterium]
MLITIPSQIGYGALFGFVFAESAGVPLPGETALIAAGLLAGSGQLALPAVIAVGAGAAILGDNLGYWLGRRGGRAMLLRDGRLARHRRKAVAKGDEFFERHGGKAVFLGRWVSGVRIAAAVLAGAGAMRRRTFLLYNALGALAWSATVAGIAALTGAVGAAIVYGAGIAAAVGGAVVAGVRAWLRRRHRPAAGAPA